MPNIVNTSGVKAGCIYRIKLVNFVTYKDVELYPGPSLNMIIGPNGTGKSTFVSALIIGLCGNIASIGRAKKISEYIRSECEEAVIEIDLYQEQGKPNVKITRVFYPTDKSKWYIDNKLVSQKNVKDLITTFDIQVDNLCQLLPQDRVKDFAKLKPHTLLQNTLSAIGEQKRAEQLEKLKNWRSEQCNVINKLQKMEKRKQDLIKENEILQGRIDAINRRKKIDLEIEACNCKKLWLEEAILRNGCRRYDSDKQAANKLVKTNQKNIQTLEHSMRSVKDEIKRLENEKLSLNSKISMSRSQMSDSLRLVNIQNERIQEAHAWYLEMEKRRDNDAKELEIAKVELDRLQMDLKQALNRYGDDTTMNSELVKLRKTMKGLENEKYKINQERQKIQYDFEHTVFPEIVRCKSKIRALEDVDKKRLQTLERYSSDAYKALLWLRDNRDLFQGPVCEPMMLEIKFTERRYSRYLEGTVSRRDLTAFTFLNSRDMDLFLTKVKQEQGLRMVNAVCSPPVRTPIESPDISAISQFGFQTYLVDTIIAHDMIVRYLCNNYKIHKIPIGNDFTYNNSGRVPAAISFFFSENHRFSVKVSRYSGDKSTSISEIQPPFLLADTVDVDKINEWKNQLSELEREEQVYQNKKREVETGLQVVETDYNQYVCKQTAVQEHINIIRQLSIKIRSAEAAVQEKSRPALDLQLERRRCARTQRECSCKQVQLQRELVPALLAVQRDTALGDLLTMVLKKKRNATVDKEKQLDELKKKLSESQERLSTIRQMEQQLVQKASAKLQEALRSSGGARPSAPQFPYADIYQQLPDELPSLQDHCNDLLTKIDCMSAGDDGDLQTYENNKKELEQLILDETTETTSNRNLERMMAKIKVEWLQFVNRLIVNINSHFRGMFARLGFGGEVRLEQGTNEDDFDSYGVAIMVKFRAGEPLRALTSTVQSGGERAISTAIYLFALQHLARAPFRCVDEINQGMDAQNERKMFEFLVNVTTEGQQGQYFLLTPKLLTDLNYNENITVHTIMNGRGALTYDQWQMESFIDKLQSYSQPS